MKKFRVLTITGLFIASLAVMSVAVYLLYPHLNEEDYQDVLAMHTTSEPAFHGDRQYIGQEFEDLTAQIEDLRETERSLNVIIDSMRSVNEELAAKVEELMAQIEAGNAAAESGAEQDGRMLFADSDGAEQDLYDEGFSERVKSLLNLDEEELAPIVNQMSSDQLIRLYSGGGTLQQEKLLRSLEPDRAAELMTEIML